MKSGNAKRKPRSTDCAVPIRSVTIHQRKCADLKLTLASIKATRDRLKLGMTESQTHDILVKQMKKRGLEDSDALVLFGENAALPHGSGTDRKLGKEDMVLIDAGGSFGGYVADITRVGSCHELADNRRRLH